MSMTIHVALFRACAPPCAKQIIATSSVESHCDDDRMSSHQQRLLEKIREAFQRCECRLAESFKRHEPECSAGEATWTSDGRSGAQNRDKKSPVHNCQSPAATQRQINVLHGMTVRHRINLRRLL